MIRKIAASLWWLGLSLYLGGMVALGLIAAPALFGGVKELGAPLPGWPIAADAPTQLGGELFGRMLLRFQAIEIASIILMAAGVIVSGWKLIRHKGLAWIQRALLAAVGLTFIYDAYFLTPEAFDVRAQWRHAVAEHADPIVIAERQAQFDLLHRRAEHVGQLKVWTLTALVVISAWGMTGAGNKTAIAP